MACLTTMKGEVPKLSIHCERDKWSKEGKEKELKEYCADGETSHA